MSKKTRKPGRRTATGKSSESHATASRQPGSRKQQAAARSPERANAPGSGLVYTDLLREALARRRG